MIRRFLQQKLGRDEFVRSMGRYVLLGVLAMLAAWVMSRRGSRDGSGASAGACQYDLPCRQCAELPGCGLARAAATRKAIRSAKS